MGDIPAQNAMVSSMILNPATGQDVVPLTDFNVQVQMNNLAAGVFTNPDATYYAAPQQLVGGKIIGHTHVTIQDLGGTLTPIIAPDAAKFVFFKGINNAGNNQGLLQATVKGGLPAGAYRVCTMAAGANHQPVLMPVAQRGAQDDCTKFTVGGGGGGKTAAGTSVVGNNKAAVAVPTEAAPAQHAAAAQNGSGNANISGSQDQNQHRNQSQSQQKAAQGKKKSFRFASQRRSRFSARIQIA